MSADKIYRSPLPDIELPETSCWHFIFNRPNQQAHDKVVYVDGLTDREIKQVILTFSCGPTLDSETDGLRLFFPDFES